MGNVSTAFARTLRSALSANEFELILMPTEKCNFRCIYCYEDFAIGRMSHRVITAVKALLTDRAPTLRVQRISWFGGEPLLAPDIVQDISGHASDLSRQHGFKLMGSMTTNGFLLDIKRMEALLSVGVSSFQISLDGSADLHDETRPLANGQPTFDAIWNNLTALLGSALDFEITLRVHVTRANQDAIETFLDKVLLEFGADKRFRIFVKAIENLGGDSRNSVPDRGRSGGIISNLNERLGVRAVTLDDGYICYAAKPNSYVIRADGSIAKCTVAFASAKNQVGNIRDDGELSLDVEKMAAWFKGYNTLDADVLRCPVSSV